MWRPEALQAPASAAPAAGFSVERLRSGWRLIANCPLGPVRVHIVLIRPGTGVALLEVEPTWHPDALAAFHATLDQEGFGSRFPGRLPVVHRRLRPVDLPAIEEILEEAFAWQDPISIEGEGSWEDEVERILTPAPVPERTAPPAEMRAAEAPMPGTSRRWRIGPAAGLAIAGVAAGFAAISLLPSPLPAPRVGVPAAADAGRTTQASLLPAGHLIETGATATDAPAAAEGPAEIATRGPPPDWVDDPVSPPPLPAAITAPHHLAWLPPPGGMVASPPPGPAATASEVLWAGAVPLGLPAPAAEDGLRVAPAPVAPPPEPRMLPVPASFGTAPPALAAADPDLAPLPDLELVPPPPDEPERPALAESTRPEPSPPPAAERPAPTAVTSPAAMPPQSPQTAQPAMPPALQAIMFRRGQSLLAIGDISGARLFLERAAGGGSAAAAMALAETYDPRRLAGLGVIGLPADPDTALTWYRRAHALGAPAAADRIATLEGPR